MIQAAGIMFLTEAGETLLLKRGPGGDFPGAWCFPGGSTEGDETAEETAKREAIEELGSLPKGERVVLTRRVAEGVDYTTFLQRVPEMFIPTINGEHTAFLWARPENLLDDDPEAGQSDADWDESKHPRADDGQFGAGAKGEEARKASEKS